MIVVFTNKQTKMTSQQTQEEMNMYDNCGLGYSDSDYEDENPEPKWNLPNWKGNASEPTVCGGCVKRITGTGATRGCEECDETWDMPDLVERPFGYDPIDTFIINKDSIDAPVHGNDIDAEAIDYMPDLVQEEICLASVKWTSPLDFATTYVHASPYYISYADAKAEAEKTNQSVIAVGVNGYAVY